MANREELGIIRGARAGAATSQLELGKRYLFGSAGLPRSLPTALHWLDRAARQDCAEACTLIGTHIPVDLARHHAHAVLPWYARAFEAGVPRAGLVLAQLALDGEHGADWHAKAVDALAGAAGAGLPEAQWLLAQQDAGRPSAPARSGAAPTRAPWLYTAADNGVAPAHYAVIEQAWRAEQWGAYLQRALPLARKLVAAADGASYQQRRLGPEDALLLARCAKIMEDARAPHTAGATEIRRFWELAANENERSAQLAVGLWTARMRIDGSRLVDGPGAANFKRAIRWLGMAGEQGLAEAWYAISRIYAKPEFSQRNVVDAQKYLERAAEMGYRDAQLECGNGAWRARRENENNDVRAIYWLQKAAAQGCAQATEALGRIAPRGPAGALGTPSRPLSTSHPLLAARIELAALFHLSRPEALLLDLKQADRGHCLVIDIRASYGRSKRRLIAVETAQERQALDRIARLFENVDCGPTGPEGNYRQRLYRLKTLIPDQGAAAETEQDAYELAA